MSAYVEPVTLNTHGQGHSQKTGRFVGIVNSTDELGTLSWDRPPAGGYDQVEVLPYTRRYLLNGKENRTDGPAVEYLNDDGTVRNGFYVVDGHYLHQPENGDVKLDLRDVMADGTQMWAAEKDGHRYETLTGPDQDTMFLRDDMLHRDGDPAVIRTDGTEEWWRDGIQYDVFGAGGTARYQGRYLNSVGSKFDGHKKPAEVSKRLRDDLKVAFAAGVIPEGLDVRVTSTSGSVRLEVTGMKDVDLYAPEIEGNPGRRLSSKAQKLSERLRRIGSAYDKSSTDWQTDYSHHSYYCIVELQDEHTQKARAELKADKAATRKAAADAKRTAG